MDRAVSEWNTRINAPSADVTILTKRLNKSYTIYGAMLLLPSTALTGPEWASIDTNTLPTLYTSICRHLKVTHIALNKPIPLNIPSTTTSAEEEEEVNNLRSPTCFTPLHGSFGPSECSSPPTEEDFSSAFWVTAKQNGIYQTWSPRWTMFSRGNISEKARLLTLPSVLRAVEEGPCAAVDLYAGIGYFAFSYVKAGVGVVLCWDLNGWSCEGLRRGATKSKWGVVDGRGWKGMEEDDDGETRLVVFHESNEQAPERMKGLKGRVPPVRHVNCGMLPSSRDALGLSAKVLDGGWDGWVHVHENFLVEEIERRAEETRMELGRILTSVRGVEVRTEVEYINRLKSYAPGVMHCVVDIMVHATLPP